MCIPEFPLSTSGPTDEIRLTAAEPNFQSSLQRKVLPRATEENIAVSRENRPYQ
jgi:hypothetical protein